MSENWEKIRDSILAESRKRGVCRSDAEDFAQDAIVKILEQESKVNAPLAFGKRVVINEIIDEARKTKRRNRVEKSDLVTKRSDMLDPLARAIAREKVEEVRKAVLSIKGKLGHFARHWFDHLTGVGTRVDLREKRFHQKVQSVREKLAASAMTPIPEPSCIYFPYDLAGFLLQIKPGIYHEKQNLRVVITVPMPLPLVFIRESFGRPSWEHFQDRTKVLRGMFLDEVEGAVKWDFHGPQPEHEEGWLITLLNNRVFDAMVFHSIFLGMARKLTIVQHVQLSSDCQKQRASHEFYIDDDNDHAYVCSRSVLPAIEVQDT